MRVSSGKALALAMATALAVLQPAGPSRAQPAAAAPAEAAVTLLGDDALDDLVAPVALYPDALLAQVLVAATYPLDIVKAQRWVAAQPGLTGDDRAAAAAAEGWDPSVSVLAAGFPTVVTRMADDLDWTEALGEAVIAQTDDVMDALQRQRGRAAAVGNLESNAAQTVTEQAGAFTIAPTDPETIYVPAYNPSTVYTQPAAAAPVIVSDAADEGYSSGALVATGAIAFGAGLLVSELFDDDDDWDDYWRGPQRFDWNDGDFYPRPGRPGINAGGDVTINVDRDGLERGPAFTAIRDRADGVRGEGVIARPADRADARAKIAARRDEGAAPGALRERAEAAAPGALRERAGAAAQNHGRPARDAAAHPARERAGEGRAHAAGGGRDHGPRAAVSRPAGGRDRDRAADRPRPRAGDGGSRGAAMQHGDGGRRAKAAEARGARSGGGGGGGRGHRG